ncbi:MAG: protoporphyrinogen oxidase [Haloferacaceae archaeon]
MTVAVVGAGITGLALTHHLVERGADVVTVEARDEAGGVIQSRRRGGHVVEVGPQRLRLTPGVDALVRAAGVEDRVVTSDAEDLYVYADGALHEAPTSREAFLRTDLLSWPAKLRLLAEPLTRPAHESETVAEAFARKFGRRAYERLVGPLYGGLYASDPAEMPAAFALAGLMAREAEAGSMLAALRGRLGGGAPPATLADGLQALPRALAARYDDAVRLNERVTAVEPVGDDGPSATAGGMPVAGDGDGRYCVTTDRGEYRAERVVVTVPAGPASDLLADVADGADGLADLTYNPLALVYLTADSVPEGALGYQVSYDADQRTLGVSFNGEAFGRDGLCTAFLGGMHDPEILGRDDDRLADVARRELATALGSEVSVVGVERRDRWFPAYDQTWWALSDLSTPPGLHLATNYTARMGITSRVREAERLAERLAG